MSSPFDISSLVRPSIRRLVPYSSARDEFSGSASVFLDANENPFNAPLNRYPDPGQLKLKLKVSAVKGIPPEYIFLGNGSDEGIDILFRVLCEPGKDNVVIVDPTYGMYGVCAQINGVERRSVLLNSDFSLDADAVLNKVDEHTRLVFLCSPNNPTSNSFNQEEMMKIIHGVNAMVVVDEAYIDFSTGPGLLSRLKEKVNLVILQTLSKAWGLAGIRLGILFAHPLLVEYLSRVKYPYNINSLTLDAALKGLEDLNQCNTWIKEIVNERKRLSVELNSLDMVNVVHPSDANFLLVRVDAPAKVYDFLMKRGIIVRDRSSVPLCEGSLRITVGTREENGLLIDALKMYAP
jgi:histidinol-phosphate aminotransferase